jgi:hypothetical protein
MAYCEYEVTIGGQKNPLHYGATGYICVGLESVPPEPFGTTLLLIDETLETPLADEIARLEDDIRAEGWGVRTRYVPRAEEFDGDAVVNNRKVIADVYDMDPDLNAVLLLGRVAVPYSGRINPDGHTNHIGAWPADAYYGMPNETDWTDNFINDDTSASRDQNKNIPGDGKFDQSGLPGDVELMVGRVDFYNMPSFEDSEVELLRKYLDKNHNYRTGNMEIRRMGLVEDNFPPRNFRYTECFASSGWRNFQSYFGAEKVEELDWIDALKTDTYLCAYGTGPGGYTSAKKIVNTNDFASTPTNAVFTMLFGSEFGDWDHKNALMRAALCSEPSVLTCSWAGRPHWYNHHMGLDYPVGYSARLSQNNSNAYFPFLFYKYRGNDYADGALVAIGNTWVHIALMGDPTLRLHSGRVPAADNLSVVQTGLHKFRLTWENSNHTEDTKYFIYRATDNGAFERLNDKPMGAKTFDDDCDHLGEIYYLVRPAEMIEDNNGKFFVEGPGILQDIIATSIQENDMTSEVSCSPNPAYDNVNIRLSLANAVNVRINIFDASGNIVKNIPSQFLVGGKHTIAWNLRSESGDRVAPGVYFVRISAGEKVFAEKIAVMN